MDRTEDTVLQMARFIKREADKEGLLPFDASGVAAVVEQAVRMAGRREKLSTAFPALADLLGEADYFARVDAENGNGKGGPGKGKKGGKAKAPTVSAAHVSAAIEAKIYRSNQVEERIQEMIDRGSLFVDTDGAVTGQVNGLAVYSMGDYAFGKPSRITAAVSMGKEGIINIEREAEMSGPTHNKGMLILSGYLRRMFAQNRPLTLAASLAFEQSYGGIDGDSASSTELYALLSALADLPLRQDVAVTGSVNQKGEVQPIGGVNEKIEGFYLCCRHAGLTGRQGVMIPASNVEDLMLKPEVVEAVRAKKFHIWAVKTIDQGIELLTGVKAGERAKDGTYPKTSVYGRVDGKLRELAEGLRDFGSKEDNGKDAGKGKARTAAKKTPGKKAKAGK
jgi:lon-related putative ATP-dependent protease